MTTDDQPPRKHMSQETSDDQLPPGPKARIVVGLRRGDAAFRAGLPVTVCPYPGTLPLSRQAWTIGYGRARRAIDPAGTPSAISEATDP